MRSTLLRAAFLPAVCAVMALIGACGKALAADVPTPEPRPPADAAQSPIEVSIAIPLHNMKQERELMYAGAKPHFHVLISNVSDRPQNIWREWCSWGYFSLSFQVTDADGHNTNITKKGRAWTVNYPDFWTIPPHESVVLEVNFADSETWDPFPRAKKDGPQKFKMRAVFEISPDDDTKKSSVWTGRVVSKFDTYTAYGRD